MKQIYVFARSKSEHLPDAVRVGELFLAPILDSQIEFILNHCASSGISHTKLKASDIISDTDTQVIITTYEDAKEVCKHFMPEIIEE